MGRISVRGGATHAVGSTTVSDANLEVVCGDGVHRPYQDLGIAASADVTAAVAAEAAARDVAIAAQAATDSSTYIARGVSGILDFTGLLGPISKPPPKQTGTVITAFQSGHGWSVTGTGATSNLNDTTTFVFGSQSISGTSNGAGASTNIRKTGLTNTDMSAKSVRLMVRVDGVAHLNAMSLFMGSSAFSNYYLAPIYNPGDGKTLREGEWSWLELNFGGAGTGSSTSGNPAKTTITDWQLQWTDDSAAAVTVHLNAVEVVPDPTAYPNGVCSITFDDAYSSQYSVARPILDGYGYAASAMVIVDQVGLGGATLTLANLQEMRDLHGWEIGGHAYTAAAHSAGFPSLSASALDNELRALKCWLVANGFGQTDYIAYPGGSTNAAIELAIQKYFSLGRTIIPGPANVLPPVTTGRVRAKSPSSATTTASLTALVDGAYANKNWLILNFHDIAASASGNQYSTANFTTVVAYLASKGIPVRPVGEVLRTCVQ